MLDYRSAAQVCLHTAVLSGRRFRHWTLGNTVYQDLFAEFRDNFLTSLLGFLRYIDVRNLAIIL